MPDFAMARAETERTGMPAVEGIAVRFTKGAETDGAAKVAKKLRERLPAFDWKPGKKTTQTATDTADKLVTSVWIPFAATRKASADAPQTPPFGETWDALREIKSVPGVKDAEPLLLTIAPLTNGSDAREAFKLWGVISEERLSEIKQNSDEKNIHWSLKKMGVEAAWEIWKARHQGKTPGEDVLVAHPDTGYTEHPRMLAILKRNGDNRGKNFVERDNNGDPTNDGRDPMKEIRLPNFPGHGTSTASIIATGQDDPTKNPGVTDNTQPWGVAPGAKILPLRVSSSVIHLSFQNVCDAFDEAITQNANVISMSLGGPIGSQLLHAKVWEALDKGIIVVSAAGNYLPAVMYPAKVPGVIACAASNVLTRPWRFSGMGGNVAITAPGELVWHDYSHPDSTKPGADAAVFSKINGDGTSFATANVAGLAALWLSYHKGKLDRYKNIDATGASSIPFAFRFCLEKSANPDARFIQNGGFGEGIAQADKLLNTDLPDASVIADIRRRFRAEHDNFIVGPEPEYWWAKITLPTLAPDPDGTPRIAPETADAKTQAARADALYYEIITGEAWKAPLPVPLDATDRAELSTLSAADLGLRRAAACVAQGGRNAVSAAAIRRYLLRKGVPLSQTLRDKMTKAKGAANAKWLESHRELGETATYQAPAPQEAENKRQGEETKTAFYLLPSADDEQKKSAYAIALPTTRRLRAFAFDPSLATNSDAAVANRITIPVVFERELERGPVGDYLEVVDVDPASNCAYAPVDLNHPYLLAQDGLPRSEGNPQFHQQMVYAVAMKTINHFEQALGRPIFWSPLRPWNEDSGDPDRAGTPAESWSPNADQFVQRLRLYPHALREQNAYYSPQKRAILFGYFPAGDGDPGAEYPGGVVFTCLAHDIIAHETTHAILDGMHVHFTEPTNPDVFAFHEAFADIVALFQRFTYPELLRDQIAKARGRLDAGTLMSQLALQFGQATGRHQALRDALGHVVRQSRAKSENEFRDVPEERQMDGGARKVTIADAADEFDAVNRLKWKRFQADPSLMAQVEEPHARGSFLVAAVFDAYLRIYEDRIADLKRIATGGTGILPDGDMHPDLVNRMANESAKSARHVLKMCIRAMDYVPPLDITFGEFLRALITADYDLVPDDPRRYRVAFIEAFRKWGIYPRNVRTLSEETLRWSAPNPEKSVLFPYADDLSNEVAQHKIAALRKMRSALLGWRPGEPRKAIFKQVREAQAFLHEYLIRGAVAKEVLEELFGGLDMEAFMEGKFQVTNLRPARRVGANGEFLTEMVFEIIQNKKRPKDAEANGETSVARRPLPFRGGVTLIVSMDDYSVRYAIHKGLDSPGREARQQDFQLRATGGSPDAAPYSSEGLRDGWFTNPAERKKWMENRTSEPDAMRASSCACRRGDMNASEAKKAKKKADEAAAKNAGIAGMDALTEPFALLHRG